MTGTMHVRARLGRTVLVAAAVALFLAPVGQMTAAREQAPRVTLQPCGRERGAAFASADCGALRVFEYRRTRQGRTIDVAFARWRSGAPAPAATATFLIAGGPGADGASLARAPETWARPLRSTMDIVIVDQRGTGRSNALFCPQDVDARPGSAFGHVFDPAWIRQCRRLLAPGGLPPGPASLHLQAIDLLIQPYPDGVSSRRGSLMAGIAHGVPTVTTLGVLSEPLWAETGCVALAPVADLSAMIAAAEVLLADPAARARLGASARQVYDQRFALERTVERMLRD